MAPLLLRARAEQRSEGLAPRNYEGSPRILLEILILRHFLGFVLLLLEISIRISIRLSIRLSILILIRFDFDSILIWLVFD